MDILDQFINYVKLDEEKRILVSIKKHLEQYLQDPQTKSMLKTSIENIVGSDFKQLEIGKNIARITVVEGSEDKNLDFVKAELVKNIEMAMSFMSEMGK